MKTIINVSAIPCVNGEYTEANRQPALLIREELDGETVETVVFGGYEAPTTEEELEALWATALPSEVDTDEETLATVGTPIYAEPPTKEFVFGDLRYLCMDCTAIAVEALEAGDEPEEQRQDALLVLVRDKHGNGSGTDTCIVFGWHLDLLEDDADFRFMAEQDGGAWCRDEETLRTMRFGGGYTDDDISDVFYGWLGGTWEDD